MLLLTHFRIPRESLNEGLLPLMSEEDMIIFLKYVPRFREVEVYIETNVSLVERHMIEQMTSTKLIKEIMDYDVNDTVGKKFDADSGNSEIDHEFGFNNPSQDEQDVSNDVDFDDVIFDDISFIMSILIFEKSWDVPTWFSDEDVDQGIDVEWKDDPYHNVDEPEEISEMFADLDEALDELDQVVAEEMVTEETVDGDDVEQVVLDDVIPHEVYVVMVAQEMLEDQTITIKRGRMVSDKEDKDNVE
ncbi:hypothetical protein Tco_0655171 [Tanacetum coccineum]|uniref:Uncharacterized protein n=1 Tax=Tanacetum coccineum TaxID=301880 RepID=A0ABQ4X5L7_9ASTR